MVSFQQVKCDACQDVVKKPKLDTHSYKCYASFTCVDCSKTFQSPAEWKGHTSCISEAEKYQKGLYRGKKNKNGTSGARGAQSAKSSNGNPSDPSDSINTNTASLSSDSANPKLSAEAETQSAAPQIEEGSGPHTTNEGEGVTKQGGDEKKNKKKRKREEERKDPPNDTSTNAQVKEKKKKKAKKDAEDDGVNANASEGNAMQLDPSASTSTVPIESHTANSTQGKNKKNKQKKNKENSAQGTEGQTGISSVSDAQASSSSTLNMAEAGKKRKAKDIDPNLNAPGESSRAVSDEAPRKKKKDKSKNERKSEAAVKDGPISETRVDEKNGKQIVNEGDGGAQSESIKKLKPRHRSRKGKKEKEGKDKEQTTLDGTVCPTGLE